MKRKLNQVDLPVEAPGSARQERYSGFEDLKLEARLLQAIAKENFRKPTPIQAKAIPLALAGKDILARAKTGSGKTAAYILPILQSLLRKKTKCSNEKSISSLILVPTRELAEQVQKAFTSFSSFCAKEVCSVTLTQSVADDVVRSVLAESPDVVISTPGRARQNIGSGYLSLESLSHLVIDEADLVLSYGYEDDLDAISKALPRGVQTFLMSATFSAEIDTLKGLFCRDPIVLELDGREEERDNMPQFVVKCAEDEKFLLTYVIFKLQLIKGKCLIFVSDVDRSYCLKLFLEQFGIKSCVLNSELPINSRIHTVDEFNKGVYDKIIAADDQELLGGIASKRLPMKAKSKQVAEEKNVSKQGLDEHSRKRQRLTTKQKDYSTSRGIDLRDIACVLNFDFPSSPKSYTHRIGRTARAGKNGMVLSFVIPAQLYKTHKPTSIPSTKHDESVLEKIIAQQAKDGKEVQPYHFDTKRVEAFRYRMNDALRAVSQNAVRKARTRELKQELLKSEKLKHHFEENPEDLRNLRHDGEIRATKVQPHLKHVPQYLVSTAATKGLAENEVGMVTPERRKKEKKGGDKIVRTGRMHNSHKSGKAQGGFKRVDPLKPFNIKAGS